MSPDRSGSFSPWLLVSLIGAFVLTGAGAGPSSARAQEEVLLAAYRQYLADHPGDVGKRMEYGRSLLERGRLAEAIEQFERVLDERPRDREVLGTLAELYSWRGRTEARIEMHERLLALGSASPSRRRTLAELYFQHGRPGDGIDQLEQILKQRPEDLELRRELANRYFWNGRPEDGIDQLERIVEARPEDLELRRELADRYESGRAHG